MEANTRRLKGEPPEISDSIHCLLLAVLESEAVPTLAGAQDLLSTLQAESLVQMCYPISGACIDAKGLYTEVTLELLNLIAYYGKDLSLEELV